MRVSAAEPLAERHPAVFSQPGPELLLSGGELLPEECPAAGP